MILSGISRREFLGSVGEILTREEERVIDDWCLFYLQTLMTNEAFTSLSTELLHRIFDYCDIETIFLSVRYVCRRFYAVSNTYNRLALNVNSCAKADYELILRLIQPEHITSLKITAWSVGEWRIRDLVSQLDLQRFTRLRSLILNGIENSALEHLLQRVTCESSNYVSIHFYDFEYDKWSTLLSLVLTHLNPRKLFLKNDSNNKYITLPTFSSVNCQLKHLVLAKCDYTACLVILQHFPQLQTFEMGLCKIEVNDGTATLLGGSSFTSSLKNLSIRECSLSSESVMSLLATTPLLVHLELISRRATLDQLFDGFYWKDIIQKKLRSLKKFDFVFSWRVTEICSFADINQLINTFQSDFWIYEKCWLTNCTYMINACEVFFHTFETNIDRFERSARCVFSPVDSIWRFAQKLRDKQANAGSIEVGG